MAIASTNEEQAVARHTPAQLTPLKHARVERDLTRLIWIKRRDRNPLKLFVCGAGSTPSIQALLPW